MWNFRQFRHFCDFIRCQSILRSLSCFINISTRGTLRQVPMWWIRLSCVERAYSDLRNVFFFHNFRGLKWIPLWKRTAPYFKTTTLAHSRLSLLLNNNNRAWSFVGKLEQVSSYVWRKIPLYQNYKSSKVKYCSSEALNYLNHV